MVRDCRSMGVMFESVRSCARMWLMQMRAAGEGSLSWEDVARGIRSILCVVVGVIALELCAHADESGRESLHVHGKIETGAMKVDLDLLRQWGVETLQTQTPFTDGEPVFTGITFARLWERIAPTGETIRARAVNDYVIEESAEQLIAMEAFLAYESDGRLLTVRDKGPFWIVFPWSRRPDLSAPGVYSLSIWQLVELEVR